MIDNDRSNRATSVTEPELLSPRRRRPAELRAAILAAATEVFLEAGYEGASIDAVIARVGGSKRAIYSYFGNKEGLFAAIVTENVAQVMAALEPEELAGHDLRSTLLDFARHLMRAQMSPTVLAVYRTVVAESARFPELAKVFYDSGPGRASARLAEVFADYRQRGEIALEDCARAADQFVGMIRDNRHLETVLGLRRPADAREIERAVQQAVSTFLDDCGGPGAKGHHRPGTR